MLKIIVSACLLSLVDSQQWTAHLGQQYPGVTPLFSRLDDGIAIASLLQDGNRVFRLLVHRYSIYGKLEAKCDVVVPAVSKRIWDLKIQRESESSLAVSWLYSNAKELGVRVLQVNVTRCSLGDTRIALYGDLDLVLYVPYYLLPRGDSGLYLFVKSPEVCEGVCRFEIGRDGQFAARDGTFTTAKDNSLVWRILAVDPADLSSGYYYIREDDPETQLAIIEKLNTSGTLLRALRTRHTASADAFAVSSSHARLSVCTPSAGCFLLRPDTFQSAMLNVSAVRVAASVGSEDASVVVVNEDNEARKFHEDGTTSETVAILKGFNADGKCFPRKMYPIFELSPDRYCTGRPCMSKSNATSGAFYQVSVAVECFRISRG